MNITLILPFLLFFLAIIINIFIVNLKINNSKQNNNAQKRILEKVRKAEQNLNENLIVTEEKISSQKIAVNNVGFSIDRRIEDLTSHGQELSKLTNTLNEYRSMLAILEVSTNKTHEWVVTVRNDCKKLQELQKIIEEHQKSTLDIITSYETAVEKQNKFYGEYETKLETLKISYISEVEEYANLTKDNLNSNMISINQAATKSLEQIQSARKIFEELSLEQIEFAKQSQDILERYKEERDEKLDQAQENLSNTVESKLLTNNSNIEKSNEKYLTNYCKELNNLNIKKMEEADNALNNLIDSIKHLQNNEFTKIENKNQANNTKVNDQKENINLDENKVELNNSDTNEKVYIPFGEEKEIAID